jgi:hypothetical protein
MLILVFFVLACNFYTLFSIYHCLFVILILINVQIYWCSRNWFFDIVFIIPPLPEGGGGYTVLPLSVCPSKIIFVAFFSVTVDGRNLIFGHKLHIGTPYRGKRFWTHQIPTPCLPTLLIFIHIEHICSFFVAFFSATIDGRNLIFGHKLHIGLCLCLCTGKIPPGFGALQLRIKL